MTISQKILKDPVNRWIFQTCDREIYIAGGFVRDVLLGRASKDRDYAVRSAVEEIAWKTSRKLKGSFIQLKKGQTYRVVLKEVRRGEKRYKAVLDFNILKSTIYNDLSGRDFTINAMAWSPKTNILDPFEGKKDLKKRIVKAVRQENLIADPLRMLRAYRFAAEYGFQIEKKTRKYIKENAKRLSTVAQERITEELFKILNAENSFSYLRECCNDRVMQAVLLSKKPADAGNHRTLGANITISAEIDALFKDISGKKNRSIHSMRIENLLNEEISMGLTRKGLIRLFLLLKDIEGAKENVRMSTLIMKALSDMNRGYSRLIADGLPAGKKIMKKELFRVFHSSGNRAFETAVITAFLGLKKLPAVMAIYDEFQKLMKRTLIDGSEIQNLLQVQQGPKIGKILLMVKEKQLAGDIRTRAEARRWIRDNYT